MPDQLTQIHQMLLERLADGENGERSFHPGIEVKSIMPGISFFIEGAVPELDGTVIALNENGDGWALNPLNAFDKPIINALYEHLVNEKKVEAQVA